MKLRLPVILVLFFVLVLHAFADYQKGMDAYKNEDYTTALKEFTPLAEQGHAEAQYQLGQIYRKGAVGVPEDKKEAVRWYTLAAKQGYVYAQINLGYMYETGSGVPQDYREAVKWYRLAAEQGAAEQGWGAEGSKPAQRILANIYAKGVEGVPQDYISAYMWWHILLTRSHSSGSDWFSNDAKKSMESIAKEMTSTQIAEAEERSQQCLNSNYKDCE